MPTLEGVVRGFRPLTLKIEKVVSTSWDGTSCVPLTFGVGFGGASASSRGSLAGLLVESEPG